jgi:hypothetical protein
MPDVSSKALDWLRDQAGPQHQVAYDMAEWALLAGIRTERMRRWFERRGVVRKGARRRHLIARDTVRHRWPGFWASVEKRLEAMFGEILPENDDDEAAA